MTWKQKSMAVLAIAFAGFTLLSAAVAPPSLLVEVVYEIHQAQDAEAAKAQAEKPKSWLGRAWGWTKKGAGAVWNTGGDVLDQGVGDTSKKVAEKAVWWVFLKFAPLWVVDSWIAIHRDLWGIFTPSLGEYLATMLLAFWLAFAFQKPPTVERPTGKEDWAEWHYLLPLIALANARGTVGVVGAVWPDALWLTLVLPALTLLDKTKHHRVWWKALRVARRQGGWRRVVKHLAYEAAKAVQLAAEPAPEEDEPATQFCGHCGRENIPDAVICGHCGQRIDTPRGAAPQPQAPAPQGGAAGASRDDDNYL